MGQMAGGKKKKGLQKKKIRRISPNPVGKKNLASKAALEGLTQKHPE